MGISNQIKSENQTITVKPLVLDFNIFSGITIGVIAILFLMLEHSNIAPYILTLYVIYETTLWVISAFSIFLASIITDGIKFNTPMKIKPIRMKMASIFGFWIIMMITFDSIEWVGCAFMSFLNAVSIAYLYFSINRLYKSGDIKIIND